MPPGDNEEPDDTHTSPTAGEDGNVRIEPFTREHATGKSSSQAHPGVAGSKIPFKACVVGGENQQASTQRQRCVWSNGVTRTHTHLSNTHAQRGATPQRRGGVYDARGEEAAGGGVRRRGSASKNCCYCRCRCCRCRCCCCCCYSFGSGGRKGKAQHGGVRRERERKRDRSPCVVC